jgi:serine/threonine protein kinase
MPGLAGIKIGHYRLREQLGRGGMSEIYLANDVRIEREVAVKIVSSRHADYIERFRREADTITTLHHPHILPALDYGEYENWHYLVMPYIAHGTLREQLAHGPLTLEDAGALLEQIASALNYAHEQGIIHRDIKPSNILMRDDHYAYLADFGLAKSLDGGSTVTQMGLLLGTPVTGPG